MGGGGCVAVYSYVCKGGKCVRGCLVAQFLPRQVYINLSHWPLVYISDCDWPVLV